MPGSNFPCKRRILLCSIVGGFTHAAPILELGTVLAKRGHEVHFGTKSGQEHWVSTVPAITRIHSFGPAMPDADTKAYYTRMMQWHPSDGVGSIMQSKYLSVSYWPDSYFNLREVMLDPEVKPDMIIADFFVEAAAKDMMIEFNVPIGIMWSPMPYLLAPASKPNHLVFVNSFFGLEAAKDLPPLMVPVRPLLSDEYPQLDDTYEAFLKSHNKTIDITLGTHIALPDAELEKLLEGLIIGLDAGHINGVIWSIGQSPRKKFDKSRQLIRADGKKFLVGDILDENHPDFVVPFFAPQRAILEHPNTKVYLTHGGGSSANETLFHGTPAGVGRAMDKFDFTPSEMADKIGQIVSDPDRSIHRNIWRMKGVAQIASRRKYLASDMVEEVLCDHEMRFKDGEALRPMHLQTADMRMSVWKARNWDLWAISISVIAIGGTACVSGFKYVWQPDFGVSGYLVNVMEYLKMG
ncbi:udp-glucosyl transferase family protein [Colletotrichum incanum]|uniref:Udp-glucosyl transferase family protein n=1 Tax=Colletotrichum incanum TaxID=1573173 RepID=A0A161YDX3_COLIC|nr:udp-glucosyl transferase family protein [Colletotrichum incanum]